MKVDAPVTAASTLKEEMEVVVWPDIPPAPPLPPLLLSGPAVDNADDVGAPAKDESLPQEEVCEM